MHKLIKIQILNFSKYYLSLSQRLSLMQSINGQSINWTNFREFEMQLKMNSIPNQYFDNNGSKCPQHPKQLN